AHARSSAAQAVEHKQVLNFRFSFRSGEGETVYQGLAHPLITGQVTAVLLMVRSTPFLPAEGSAFAALGSVARMALDNAELAGLNSTQKRDLDQLLEISGDLGATSRLEAFLPKFVVRAADFLGFSRAFVALVESHGCRLRWAASKGVSSRLEIDISLLGGRM